MKFKILFSICALGIAALFLLSASLSASKVEYEYDDAGRLKGATYDDKKLESCG